MGGAVTDAAQQGWDYVASGGKSGFDLDRVATATVEGAALGKLGQLGGKVIGAAASRLSPLLPEAVSQTGNALRQTIRDTVSSIEKGFQARFRPAGAPPIPDGQFSPYGPRDGVQGPGPHAGQSILWDESRKFDPPTRIRLNKIMSETGCHMCGTRRPGTNPAMPLVTTCLRLAEIP